VVHALFLPIERLPYLDALLRNVLDIGADDRRVFTRRCLFLPAEGRV
jgi:hypothetical protein